LQHSTAYRDITYNAKQQKEFVMDAKHFLNTCGQSLTEWDADLVSRMAHGQGYHFTTDELETAADELWGNLSEEQLRDITGAGSIAAGGTTVTANTSTATTISTATVWAPPPGDVSGNSCFFTRR
jgi:hypothetical protein